MEPLGMVLACYGVFYLLTRSFLLLSYVFGAGLLVFAIGYRVTVGPELTSKEYTTLVEAAVEFVTLSPAFIPFFGDVYWLAVRPSGKT